MFNIRKYKKIFMAVIAVAFCCSILTYQFVKISDSDLDQVNGGCSVGCIEISDACDSILCDIGRAISRRVSWNADKNLGFNVDGIWAHDITDDCYMSFSISGTPPYCAEDVVVSIGITFLCESDTRLKTDITPVKSVYEEIGLQAYSWDWNSKANNLGLHGKGIGLLAQDVQKLIPFAVLKGEDGFLRINYSMIDEYLKMDRLGLI